MCTRLQASDRRQSLAAGVHMTPNGVSTPHLETSRGPLFLSYTSLSGSGSHNLYHSGCSRSNTIYHLVIFTFDGQIAMLVHTGCLPKAPMLQKLLEAHPCEEASHTFLIPACSFSRPLLAAQGRKLMGSGDKWKFWNVGAHGHNVGVIDFPSLMGIFMHNKVDSRGDIRSYFVLCL